LELDNPSSLTMGGAGKEPGRSTPAHTCHKLDSLYFRSKAGVEVFDHRSDHQGGNEAGQGVDSRTCLPAIRLALSGHLFP